MEYIIKCTTTEGYKYYYVRNVVTNYLTSTVTNATKFKSLPEVVSEIKTFKNFKLIKSVEVLKIETKIVTTPLTLLDILTGE